MVCARSNSRGFYTQFSDDSMDFILTCFWVHFFTRASNTSYWIIGMPIISKIVFYLVSLLTRQVSSRLQGFRLGNIVSKQKRSTGVDVVHQFTWDLFVIKKWKMIFFGNCHSFSKFAPMGDEQRAITGDKEWEMGDEPRAMTGDEKWGASVLTLLHAPPLQIQCPAAIIIIGPSPVQKNSSR